MAKNVDVILAFTKWGGTLKRTTNLRIEGDKLFNYNTCLAEKIRHSNGLVSFKINVTSYSKSTTAIQNMLLRAVEFERFECFAEVPQGAQSL